MFTNATFCMTFIYVREYFDFPCKCRNTLVTFIYFVFFPFFSIWNFWSCVCKLSKLCEHFLAYIIFYWFSCFIYCTILIVSFDCWFQWIRRTLFVDLLNVKMFMFLDHSVVFSCKFLRKFIYLKMSAWIMSLWLTANKCFTVTWVLSFSFLGQVFPD